jgi:hypothetical protein
MVAHKVRVVLNMADFLTSALTYAECDARLARTRTMALCDRIIAQCEQSQSERTMALCDAIVAGR